MIRNRHILLIGVLCVMSTSPLYAHTTTEPREQQYFEQRKIMYAQCMRDKVNLLRDNVNWVLSKLQSKEKKVWSYASNGSNMTLQSSCSSGSSCESILSGFSRCNSRLSSCIRAIPNPPPPDPLDPAPVLLNKSCPTLRCYEEKADCVSQVMTNYASCIRNKMANTNSSVLY